MRIVDTYNEGGIKQFASDEEFERIGSGSYGTVYGYKGFAIKYIHDPSDYGNNDVQALKDLSHLDCIPTLYAVVDNRLIITDKIIGENVKSYVHKDDNSLNIGEEILDHLNDILSSILFNGYSPQDVHWNNVMIETSTKTLKIVDLGFFFKHEKEYNDNNYSTDDGYQDALDWVGKDFRKYFRKLNELSLNKYLEAKAM
jgi:tRNA A-37 threonylcarbamoyl transferase component Bud32